MRVWRWFGMLLALFGLASIAVSGVTLAQAGPPPAHQTIGEYTGPETCATCHPNAAREVAESLHYQQVAIASSHVPSQEGQQVGMLHDY